MMRQVMPRAARPPRAMASTERLLPAWRARVAPLAPTDSSGRTALGTDGFCANALRLKAPVAAWREASHSYLARRLATTLMVVARITTPNTYDNTAWRKAAFRIGLEMMSVSETWKVIPRVRATYAKSPKSGRSRACQSIPPPAE